MEKYQFRTYCFYDKQGMLGCFVYHGDGKYINGRRKINLGITHHFIKELVTVPGNEAHINLFLRLVGLEYDDVLTEGDLETLVLDGLFDTFTFGASQAYEYPYERDSKGVFTTVCRNEQLKDFNQFKGEKI